MLAASSGCVLRVRPPVDPAAPVTVFIADYGQHASLILPRGARSAAEFAYGEWGWFALGRQGWYRALPAIAVPTPGALGTRDLNVPPKLEQIRAVLPVEHLHAVVVSREKAEALLARFDLHLAARGKDEVYNADLGLRFVPYPVPYCLLCQCNSLVVNWLRELDCSVQGLSPTARFVVDNGQGE